MIQAAIFTTGLAVAFAVVLALVLFSGRLSATRRQQLERLVGAAVATALIASFGWSLAEAFRDDDWRLSLAVTPVFLVWIGVTFIRQRRRKAREAARKPQTFA